MRVPIRLIPIILLCPCLCLLALAPATAPAQVTRFINEQTMVAAEADLTKLDAAQIESFLMQLGKSAEMIGPNPLQTTEAEAKQFLGRGTKWVNDAKQAGATAVYVIVDSGAMQRFGPAVIIPVPDAKAAAVAKLVPLPAADGGPKPAGTQPAARPGPNQQQVATIPGVGVVVGAGGSINAVKAIKPAPRADLDAAFKQAAASPIKLAFALNPRLRQDAAKNMPPMILGKPSTLIHKDFQWLSVAATPPPNVTIKAVVQSTDANTAKQTDELIVSAIVMNQNSPQKLPDEAVTLLTPQPQGSQLVLALDAGQLNQLAVAMREPLMRGRTAALRVKSASNIRQILQGCLLYSNDNKGKYPPNLQELEKSMLGFMDDAAEVKLIFTNPARPEQKPAYVYIPPAQGNAAPADMVVIYEAHKQFGDGVNVGFADGHVEFVAKKEQFDQMLAKTAQQGQ